MKTVVADQYNTLKQNLVAIGYGGEIEWQSKLRSDDFTESDLLRETAWVILCSGFREEVVRRHFDFISLCFCDWESADVIISCGEVCLRTASARFNNRKKLQSILQVAGMVSSAGFGSMKAQIAADPIEQLQKFRHVGPVTAFHLAKNLGFLVAKNDRHLERVAKFYGFSDAHELCHHVAVESGDSVSVVDIVLWRMSALTPNWFHSIVSSVSLDACHQKRNAVHFDWVPSGQLL